MKYLLSFFLIITAFLLQNNVVWSQHIASSTLQRDTTPHYIQRQRKITDTAAYIEQRLIQLALKQPSYQQSEYEKSIASDQLTKAKNSWLDLLSISANFNDQTFAPKSTQSTYVYPKYFFGLTIPLGLIFNRSSDMNIARDNLAINTSKQEEIARAIKADILSKYKQYKSFSQLLAIQDQVVDDQQAVFLQTEQNFRDGKITIDVYTAASKGYKAELANRINLQLQKDLVKIEIEKIIGMTLEDALGFSD